MSRQLNDIIALLVDINHWCRAVCVLCLANKIADMFGDEAGPGKVGALGRN